MKVSQLIYALVTMTLLFTSCIEQVDETQMLGAWQGTDWTIEGHPGDYNATSVFFTFMPDGSYTYQYADMQESGVYDIRNNQLYTTPKGGMEMMVKIQKLLVDTLVFDMNRGGQAETLTLIRK
jgi:hypothetical protein